MMIWLNNVMYEVIDSRFYEMSLRYVMCLYNDMIWINMPKMMHKDTIN